MHTSGHSLMPGVRVAPQPAAVPKEGSMAYLLAHLIEAASLSVRRERGQGMVEYGLIIAAVAIAVIVALFALGPQIASMFSSTAASLK